MENAHTGKYGVLNPPPPAGYTAAHIARHLGYERVYLPLCEVADTSATSQSGRYTLSYSR